MMDSIGVARRLPFSSAVVGMFSSLTSIGSVGVLWGPASWVSLSSFVCVEVVESAPCISNKYLCSGDWYCFELPGKPGWGTGWEQSVRDSGPCTRRRNWRDWVCVLRWCALGNGYYPSLPLWLSSLSYCCALPLSFTLFWGYESQYLHALLSVCIES